MIPSFTGVGHERVDLNHAGMSRALSEARNAIAVREKEARALKLDLEQLRAAKSSSETTPSGQANGTFLARSC